MIYLFSSILLVSNLFLLIESACKDQLFTQLTNGKCYRVVASYQYYKDADASCKNLNAQLATIHSKTDNDALSQWINNNRQDEVWIGLQAVQQNPNVYQWTDSSPLDYTNFFANPPDVSNGNQCFLLRSNGYWYPQHCLRFTDFALCEEISMEATCGDYDEIDGTCLKVKLDALSFNDAEKDCRQDGGNLVSIHDSMMNANVYNEFHLIGVGTVGWIGLQQVTDTLSWTDATKFDYNNLAVPKNPDGCFAMSVVTFLYQKQWVAEACTSVLPYICHREKSVNPVTKAPPSTTIHPSICGQSEFSGSQGTISSPGYPAHFSDDDCYYQINGTLNAINLDVPAISGPEDWRLDIYAGSYANPSMRIYSISSLDAPKALKYSSPIPWIYIHFQADSDNYGTPFQMSWTSTTNPQYPLGDLTGSTITPPPPTGPTGTYALCDKLWIYDDVRNVCLGFTQALKWNVSKTLCEQQNAQLLSIHDFAEEQNIIGILDNLYHPGNYQLWIGGYWIAGYWRWTDNSNFQYKDFINGDDGHPNGDCLSIEYYSPSNLKGWRSADCTLDFQAICFKPPNQSNKQT